VSDNENFEGVDHWEVRSPGPNDNDIIRNLSQVADHWEKSAKELLGYEWESEILKACDMTAAIILQDNADELRRVIAGGAPTLNMSPEEKLQRALAERS